MKKQIALFLVGFCMACGSSPKGNPELVKQAEKIAELGCACQDVKCLYDIKVDDKGVMAIINAKLDDLTEAEKEKYYAAVRKYGDCEKALSEKAKK
jgi:hypothetical protein